MNGRAAAVVDAAARHVDRLGEQYRVDPRFLGGQRDRLQWTDVPGRPPTTEGLAVTDRPPGGHRHSRLKFGLLEMLNLARLSRIEQMLSRVTHEAGIHDPQPDPGILQRPDQRRGRTLAVQNQISAESLLQ